MVDDGDFETLSGFNWHSACGDKYACRHDIISGKKVYMHRIILNPTVGFEVDHINGNGFDNRRKNLRLCRRHQNAKNQGLKTTNTSGFKGVSKHRKKWMAYIDVNYKRTYLGHFNTKEEAAASYNSASKRLHKAFSRPNKIP